jgi:hypothetical protein
MSQKRIGRKKSDYAAQERNYPNKPEKKGFPGETFPGGVVPRGYASMTSPIYSLNKRKSTLSDRSGGKTALWLFFIAVKNDKIIARQNVRTGHSSFKQILTQWSV